MRPGAGRSRSVILPCFCFKLTISPPPAQNLIQQWQRALSPGKQISGQFNSVNPRNSNHPSARGKMRLDILTWLNEPFSSSFLTCVLPHLPVCRFHFLSLQYYTQRAGYPPINGARISPNAVSNLSEFGRNRSLALTLIHVSSFMWLSEKGNIFHWNLKINFNQYCQ